MAAAKWKAFPHPSKAFAYPGEALKKHWDHLHHGDREPFPRDKAVQEAWRHFHAGKFAEALAAGLAAGGAGITAANKAQTIYANGVESKEAVRIALFEEVMKRAGAQAKAEPKNANAHYLYAFAAGRYSQRISVVMMHGKKMVAEAGRLYSRAAELEPRDAMEKLDVEAARAEID